MRSIKVFGLALLAALSLTAMASATAGAVTWNPQNTNTGPGTGTLTLTTNGAGSPSVTCSVANTYALASGAVATTTNAAGTAAGPGWTGCSNTISASLRTCVSSSSAWTLTAASTTAVNVTNGNAVIELRSPGTATCSTGTVICRITAASVTVNTNAWSNATHALTANSSTSFPITESGICDGGTRGTMAGTVTFPSAVTIA
jgi:hypothetical protein